MKPSIYGKNICPKCGIRPRQEGRTYCAECENERKREAYHAKHHPVSPEFRALLQEAREVNVRYLRDMGWVGRTTEGE